MGYSDQEAHQAAYLKRQEVTGSRRARLADARAIAQHTPEQWEAVLQETDPFCVRCGTSPEDGRVKDHIVPLCMGGSDGIDNLQPICRRCNSAKGTETINWLAIWRAGRSV